MMLHHCETPAILPWSATVTAALVRATATAKWKGVKAAYRHGPVRLTQEQQALCNGGGGWSVSWLYRTSHMCSHLLSLWGGKLVVMYGWRARLPLPPHPWWEQIYTRASHTHLCEWNNSRQGGREMGGWGAVSVSLWFIGKVSRARRSIHSDHGNYIISRLRCKFTLRRQQFNHRLLISKTFMKNSFDSFNLIYL